MRSFLACIVLLLFCGAGTSRAGEDFARLGPVRLLGEAPSFAEIGLGAFNVDNGENGASAAVKLEFRPGTKLGFVGPAIGVLANEDSGVFGYAGLYADLVAGPLVLTPLFSVGAYHNGGGKKLGGVFEFRSSLGLYYGLSKRTRFGVSVDHISNADLHEENPGANNIFLNFARGF